MSNLHSEFCSQRWISLKTNAHACLHSSGVQQFNYVETLAKTFFILARQKEFFQGNAFNNAPLRRIAVAINTTTAFTGSNTENPIWFHQFDLRQIKTLRGSQPIVDFDAADNCRLNITTMKAMNFQDKIPSIPMQNFKSHFMLVLQLTSIQEAIENCRNLELVGEPLRLELNVIYLMEHITQLIVLGERVSSVAVDKFGVFEKWI